MPSVQSVRCDKALYLLNIPIPPRFQHVLDYEETGATGLYLPEALGHIPGMTIGSGTGPGYFYTWFDASQVDEQRILQGVAATLKRLTPGARIAVDLQRRWRVVIAFRSPVVREGDQQRVIQRLRTALAYDKWWWEENFTTLVGRIPQRPNPALGAALQRAATF